MAATSRTIAKSSAAAAFNLFNNSKPILNRQLPQRALPVIESAVTKLVKEQFVSEGKIVPKQEQMWIAKPRSAGEEVNMMMVIEMARQQKVPYGEDDYEEDDEDEDDSDFEMIDDEEEEDDEDEFEDEEEEFVNSKVRTRSHRDL